MTTDVHRLTVVTEETGFTRFRRRFGSVIAHTLLVIASIIMLYPLLWMLSASFRPTDEIFNSGLWPSEFSLDAYFRGWKGLKVSFGTFFLNSFIISILSIAGNVFACSLAAFAFARLEFKGRKFWFAMMLGTLMLPYQVTLIPQYVLFLNLGWVNSFLPLVVPKFLASDAFFIFLMVQFFRGIPYELEEAARVDGAGPVRTFAQIILPLSKSSIAVLSVFTFLSFWNSYLWPLIVTVDYGSLGTLPVGLASFSGLTGTRWDLQMAASIISMIPTTILVIALQKHLVKGIAMAGLGGR